MGSQKKLLAATAAIAVLATGWVYPSAEPHSAAADAPECTPVVMAGVTSVATLGACREDDQAQHASLATVVETASHTPDADAVSAPGALEAADAVPCGTGLMPTCYEMDRATCVLGLSTGPYRQDNACDSESKGCVAPVGDGPDGDEQT